MYVLIQLTDSKSISRFERMVSGSIDIVRASGTRDTQEFSVDKGL